MGGQRIAGCVARELLFRCRRAGTADARAGRPRGKRDDIRRKTRPTQRKETSHATIVERLISSHHAAQCVARRKTPRASDRSSRFGIARIEADDGRDADRPHAGGDESRERRGLVAGLDVHRRLPGLAGLDHPRGQHGHRPDDVGYRSDEPRRRGLERQRHPPRDIHQRGRSDDPSDGRHAHVPRARWGVSGGHLPCGVGGNGPRDVRHGCTRRLEWTDGCGDELRRSDGHPGRWRHLPADRGDDPVGPGPQLPRLDARLAGAVVRRPTLAAGGFLLALPSPVSRATRAVRRDPLHDGAGDQHVGHSHVGRSTRRPRHPAELGHRWLPERAAGQRHVGGTHGAAGERPRRRSVVQHAAHGGRHIRAELRDLRP